MYEWRGKRKRHLFGREDGFTLTEILITIVILGILVAIAVPIYNAQRAKSDDMVLKSDLIAAATNIEQSKIAFGGKYPSSLVASSGVPIAKATNPGVSFAYSIPYDRTNYCLQGTYEGKKLFVSHTTQTPTANDCTYAYVIPAPENFFVSVDLTFIPKARWDAVDGATSYNVYKDGTKVASFATNSGALPSMGPGTTASYWVRAVTSGAETDDSNKMTITAPVPAPSTAPVLSNTQTADNGTAMTTSNKLSWTAVQWATSYLLYDADTDQLLNPGGGSTTIFNVTVEKQDVKRYYVIASNATGNGPKSNIVTIAPKFVTPALTGTIDDFTVKSSFSWQTMASTYGTGATAKMFTTDGAFTSSTITSNTYTTTQGRIDRTWKVRITTGNGFVIDSNAVLLSPKDLPVISTIYQNTWQNLDSTLTNTPSYYGLNSSNSTWRVDVSDSTAFTKIYPQSSEDSTDPNDTFSGLPTPTHGGTYYTRYVITRNSDGATLTSLPDTVTIPTRMMDVGNDGVRDVLVMDGNAGQVLITPTGTGGSYMDYNGYTRVSRVVGADCVVIPVQDAEYPGSKGFICWRHNANNGYLDYYHINENKTINAPIQVGGAGWNMYSSLTVVQNYFGDDYPALVGMASGDGTLQVWRMGGSYGIYPSNVDRNAGTCWTKACSGTSVVKGIYDWNGVGSVGMITTLTQSPWARYYPIKKNPALTANQNINGSVSLTASWSTAANPANLFPTDQNPNGCCSYVYSRSYGNAVINGQVLPVFGLGPSTYFDAFWGNGAGSFAAGKVNWGYQNNSKIWYTEQNATIR